MRFFHTEYRVKTKWEDEVRIIFTTDIKRSVQKCGKKYNVEVRYESESEALHYCTRNLDETASAWMFFLIDKVKPGRIAHESLHTIKEILERLPCRLSSKTEEIWCYSLEEIVDQIFELYLKAVVKFKSRKR